MSNSPAQLARPVRPVILGADIGIYALARAFHEQYGVVSTVVAAAALGPIADSKIIDLHIVKHNYDPALIVSELVAIGKANEGKETLILLANSDWFVRVIVQNREQLEPYFVVPFLDLDVLDRISDKASFAQVCGELGLSVPITYVQDFAESDSAAWTPISVDLEYPLIAKAASSADYQDIEFEGKKKVFEIASQEELAWLWSALRDAGFKGRFVVQEMIPGDDTQMWSITAYVDQSGAITLLGGAHVLLEEHTPNGLGNPAAMITKTDSVMFEQASQFLAHVGYRGFANFDVKIDPRDGQFKFFEVNPRIGRNNYYMTAAGGNPARVLVEDYVLGNSLEQQLVTDSVLYSVVPVRMLDHYVREPQLNALLTDLIKRKRYVHPLDYRKDAGFKRRLYLKLAVLNQKKKFKKHYPNPTGTGF